MRMGVKEERLGTETRRVGRRWDKHVPRIAQCLAAILFGKAIILCRCVLSKTLVETMQLRRCLM